MPRTILLADDSPTIRKIVELTFSDTDLRVETVGTGKEAIEKIESLQPDLVLADVVMPEPAGYEICRLVKGSDRPVPVVLLAGTFEPFDPEAARQCGADAHLVKPFESQALREKVEQLLAEAEAARAAAAAASGTGPAEVESVLEELSESPSPEAAESPGGDSAATSPAGGAAAAAPDVDPALVDAVAREVVKRLSEIVIREIAWEVVPELASRIVRERIRELEGEDPGEH